MPLDMLAGFFGAGQDGSAGYQIARSLRFNSGDSANLSRTFASAPTTRTKGTFSAWVKRSAFGATQSIFEGYDGASANQCIFRFTSADALEVYFGGSAANNIITSRVFRDPSAWYHLCLVIDTTISSPSSDRVKIFVNGVQETAFGTTNYPAQNATHQFTINTANNRIGTAYNASTAFIDALYAEIHWVDGSALTPSTFGQTDSTTGAWVPKQVTGVTYGANGFYLALADNSGTTSTTLGKDSSGNSNNWTPNNFSVTAGSGNDSLTDTPTSNFCTLNSYDRDRSQGTLADGALDWTTTYSDNYAPIKGTFPVATGQWVFEVTNYTTSGANDWVFGWTKDVGDPTGKGASAGTIAVIAARCIFGGTISKFSDGTSGTTITSATWSAGDTFQMLVDFDNGKYWVGKGGNYYNAANSLTTYSNASPTGTFTPGSLYVPFVETSASSDNSNRSAVRLNFGQRAFANTPPTGFQALSTANLATPAIVKPGVQFNALAWQGNNGSRSLTGLGFQPDLVIGKLRNTTGIAQIYDSVRGTGKRIAPDAVDQTTSPVNGYLNSFDSDGFSVVAGSTDVSWWNASPNTHVAWCWKEGVTPGFDIVSFTGTGSAQTVAHNLGVAPEFILWKPLTGSANFVAGHKGLNGGSNPWQYYTQFNGTAAQAASSSPWNNTAPTSSVFTVGTNAANTVAQIAYVFASVAGFSRFGSYTGNGSTDGPFVQCGFRPRCIMWKRVDTTGAWYIYDTVRRTYNVTDGWINPNSSAAESTGSEDMDILSNGFKPRSANTDINASGGTYIFAAFAEFPFKYATAR